MSQENVEAADRATNANDARMLAARRARGYADSVGSLLFFRLDGPVPERKSNPLCAWPPPPPATSPSRAREPSQALLPAAPCHGMRRCLLGRRRAWRLLSVPVVGRVLAPECLLETFAGTSGRTGRRLELAAVGI